MYRLIKRILHTYKEYENITIIRQHFLIFDKFEKLNTNKLLQ